jgi:hypothetical protein
VILSRLLFDEVIFDLVMASARPLELERVWIPALWQLPQKARGLCSPYTVPLRPALLRPSTAAAGFVKFMIDFFLFAALVNCISLIFVYCPLLLAF